MKTFNGRVVAAGEVTAEALVSHGGLNTLASFQKALQFGDKSATCGDQNNPDLYGKKMLGKALCLPMTIGSTTGGLVLYCACAIWIVCFRKNSVFRALALSVIPSVLFLFSGIMSRSVLLIISSVIFAPSHIIISYRNAK